MSSKRLSALKNNTLITIPKINQILADKSLSMIERITELEKHILMLPPVDAPVKHYFGEDVYVRETLIPGGTFAIGELHNFDHVSIMISGEIYMWTEFDGLIYLAGYNPVIAKAGIKRAAYIVKDTLWINAHAIGKGVDESNVRDYLTSVSYEEYLKFKDAHMVEIEYTVEDDRNDYNTFLDSINLDESQALQHMNSSNKLRELPSHLKNRFELKSSPIEGLGVFSKIDYGVGQYLGPARQHGTRTIFGRYVNHSRRPNSEIRIEPDGTINMYALKRINGGDEVTSSYHSTLEARRLMHDLDEYTTVA
jgi:hypothetical protein